MMEINVYKVAWENALALLDAKGITFSKSEAESLVGETALRRLIISGEIDAVKKGSRQNSSWRCNAADVMRHLKRKKKSNP